MSEEKPKKKPPYNENAVIRAALRRAFSARSPVPREVLRKVRREVPQYKLDGSRSKKDAVQYQCALCNNWVGSSYISVDHKEPVIDVILGFQGWEIFIQRLFCGPENLQPICDDCHQKKTNIERWTRNVIEDRETLRVIEEATHCQNPDWKEIKKGLGRFSNKRIAKYPEDLICKVRALKELARGKK